MKHIQYSRALLTIAIIGLSAIYGIYISFAQVGSSDDFRITQILRNDNNLSVVAFTLYGSFENEDVVNIYSNDVFIKAKAINTPDLIGTKEITIDNISIDVFQTGDNLIIAQLERSGTVIQRTPAFRLTIQEPPEAPTVTTLTNKEKNLIGLSIEGIFKENDIIRVFLNDAEIRAKTILPADVGERVVQITGIPIDTLIIGENFFTASIRRGEHESKRSEKSNPVIIQDAEEQKREEERINLLQCANYTEPQKILAEHIDTYEGFGNMLAAKNGVLVVGTRGEKTHIYVKNKEHAAWMNSAMLREQHFQQSGLARKVVAIQDQRTVLIGDANSGYAAEHAGAVRIYKQTANTWENHATIAPADLEPYESFGKNIALDKQLLAVGAARQDNSGAVYIYSYNAGQWKNPFRIVPKNTAPNQEFGYSVTVSNGTVAVGAPGDGIGKNGAVYVYTKPSGTWIIEKIAQQNQRLNARFGSTVLLFDDTLFVSAMRDDQGKGTLNRGVVYVYKKQNGIWQVVQKLKPEEDDTSGEFGTAIARSGNMLAIGAPKSNVGRSGSGAVYLYKQTSKGEQWSYERSITPNGLRSGDRFGASVTFSGLDLLVGAYGDDDQEKNSGAVYNYPGKVIACISEADSQNSGMVQEEVQQSETDLLQALKQQKETLNRVAASASSIASQLDEHIQGVYDVITRREEGIVIYDEEKVLANAQRRAAERRGIIGPGLPDEVTTQRVDSIEKVPARPTEETIRPRESVVRETEDAVGTVVPIANKDLRLGDVDEDVYRLQVFLNTNGYRVATEGAGSPGNETSVFNEATDRALRWFQLVEGVPVTGVLDKKTRDLILTHITTFK